MLVAVLYSWKISKNLPLEGVEAVGNDGSGSSLIVILMTSKSISWIRHACT